MTITTARIAQVVEGSPADDAGFTEGCLLHSVNGEPLRDILDWQWLTADVWIRLEYTDTDGETSEIELERDYDEPWGFEFEGTIFDDVKLCRNACSFCFMRQLPDDVRPSLSLRDDDFRWSFLQGTFVTLTNLTSEDEARIIEQHISPLRFSLHAVTEDIRLEMIGKHAQHGLLACERLLNAGIEMHMQIVLLPGVNDGAELTKTLDWAYRFDEILSIGIVPVGFTKHQSHFERSFNDQKDAYNVIERIEAFQKKALDERGTPWVYAADEFYRNAFPQTLLDNLPPDEHYGDYDMFEDGIGIIRSFIEDWNTCDDLIESLAAVLKTKNMKVCLIMGHAQREFVIPLVDKSPLRGLLIPFPIKNDYFGGNVDVTGLLTGQDIILQLAPLAKMASDDIMAVIPSVVFNADHVTLDDMSLEDIRNQSSIRIEMVSCNASEYLAEIANLLHD